MTEPAPPPGGDPTRPGTGPDAGPAGGSGTSPEITPMGYAPAPVSPQSAPPRSTSPAPTSPHSAPPGSWPPAGPYPPAPPGSPPHPAGYGVPGAPGPSTPPVVPPHYAGYGAGSSTPPGSPSHHGGYGAPPVPGPHSGPSAPVGWPGSGAYPGNQPAPGGGWATPGSAPAGGGWGSAPPAAVPPPPREAPRPPKRVDAVPGTPFGVVHLDVPPVTSGLAIGSLVIGIASILVSLLVLCFGVAGPNYGGAWAAGAFTVLGAIAGTAAVVAGLLARRQIRRPAPPPAVRFTGRGLAVAGLSCGGVGLLVSLGGLALALVVQIT
ncbi:hypothetical protein GA0070603_4717 [Micromonospora chersina]|uniref:Uncharacterized protein n=1 Tax=Micromonospora chersina TaxID=47854 RepID=A0A1C6VPN6_9ACTN|nr:hypothetical protein GA0070603_4717 [Micromonospora chersina]